MERPLLETVTQLRLRAIPAFTPVGFCGRSPCSPRHEKIRRIKESIPPTMKRLTQFWHLGSGSPFPATPGGRGARSEGSLHSEVHEGNSPKGPDDPRRRFHRAKATVFRRARASLVKYPGETVGAASIYLGRSSFPTPNLGLAASSACLNVRCTINVATRPSKSRWWIRRSRPRWWHSSHSGTSRKIS